MMAYCKDCLHYEVCKHHEAVVDFEVSDGVCRFFVPDKNVGEWIPVTERLPEDKINCLVHYKHAYSDNDGYWSIGISFFDGDTFRIDWAYKVTHWMPLPQPPKEEL